ncbi:hypothetical protein ACP70R_000589 [Stipagrostis hirtigluma subsp. patula]
MSRNLTYEKAEHLPSLDHIPVRDAYVNNIGATRISISIRQSLPAPETEQIGLKRNRSESKDKAMATADGWNLPTDAFVEVLLLLPPSKRRRLRLVCRHWRDVIDERAPAKRSPRALAFVVNHGDYHLKVSAAAYVIDDLAGGRCRELWRSKVVHPARRDGGTVEMFDTAMVGTCNGLLCLCDNKRPGGAIFLVSPAAGETLAVPRLPRSRRWSGTSCHKAYSFAYEPTTERYKIVHVPSYLDKTGGFSAVQVFTLGEGPAAAAWRDVPTPGASCCHDAGIVSVGGATHWVTRGAGSVVSLDLKEERVAAAVALPVAAGRGYDCHLTEVHGMLGLVAVADRSTPAKAEVWVLGDGRDRQRWSRRYSVQMNRWVWQSVARPHVVHGGHVLTTGEEEVFSHRLSNAGRVSLHGEVRSVRISERTPAVFAMSGAYVDGVFAYDVETTEPLNAYKYKVYSNGIKVDLSNLSC